MGRHVSPRYGQVIVVSGTLFRQLSIDHNQGGGDELVNRSYRDRAADDLGHRDVTRNLSREL